MDKLIPDPEPSAEDAAVRDAVLLIAERHAAKMLDHWEVRRQCNGDDRFTATRNTPTDHPSRLALLAMLDDLIAQDPTQQYGWSYATKHGVFSEAEFRRAEAVIGRDGERIVIRFPIRYGKFGPEFQARVAESTHPSTRQHERSNDHEHSN